MPDFGNATNFGVGGVCRVTEADADRIRPAVQPLGEVVDPRQRRGAGGRSNDEEVLDAETESFESCCAVTFMPPSTAQMPMGRCRVSRRLCGIVSLLFAHSHATRRGLDESAY